MKYRSYEPRFPLQITENMISNGQSHLLISFDGKSDSAIETRHLDNLNFNDNVVLTNFSTMGKYHLWEICINGREKRLSEIGSWTRTKGFAIMNSFFSRKTGYLSRNNKRKLNIGVLVSDSLLV